MADEPISQLLINSTTNIKALMANTMQSSCSCLDRNFINSSDFFATAIYQVIPLLSVNQHILFDISPMRLMSQPSLSTKPNPRIDDEAVVTRPYISCPLAAWGLKLLCIFVLFGRATAISPKYQLQTSLLCQFKRGKTKKYIQE
jgi:hypothetical protein